MATRHHFVQWWVFR